MRGERINTKVANDVLLHLGAQQISLSCSHVGEREEKFVFPLISLVQVVPV